MMQGRIQIGDPKGQQQQNKRDNDAKGEAAAGAAKKFVRHLQFQIDQPEQRRPDDFCIREIRRAFGPGQVAAGSEADGEQNKSGEHQPRGDHFEPLNGGKYRQHGAEFVGLQSVALREEHSRRHRAEAERAIREQNRRRVQAGEPVGKFRLRSVRRIERRHEREYADRAEHRRGEGAEKFQARQKSDGEARERERPEQERGGFVKIVDGTGVQPQPALEHRRRVQRETGKQQEKIDVVVPAKTFAPQENRMQRAQTIDRDGEQKEMSFSEPSHADRLNPAKRGARRNYSETFFAKSAGSNFLSFGYASTRRMMSNKSFCRLLARCSGSW